MSWLIISFKSLIDIGERTTEYGGRSFYYLNRKSVQHVESRASLSLNFIEIQPSVGAVNHWLIIASSDEFLDIFKSWTDDLWLSSVISWTLQQPFSCACLYLKGWTSIAPSGPMITSRHQHHLKACWKCKFGGRLGIWQSKRTLSLPHP